VTPPGTPEISKQAPTAASVIYMTFAADLSSFLHRYIKLLFSIFGDYPPKEYPDALTDFCARQLAFAWKFLALKIQVFGNYTDTYGWVLTPVHQPTVYEWD